MNSKQTAIQNAIKEASIKDNDGKLIPSDLWDDTKHSDDCETVYSIISLYSDDENNDGTWEASIESVLLTTYPSYF